MKKAIIYARHSSKKQNALSTRDQIDLCQAFCAKRKLEVVRVFCDEALPGSHHKNRKGFGEMRSFLQHNHVNAVVCEDSSRIARNLADIARFYNILEFLDIELISLNDGKLGLLQVGLKGTMDSLYLQDLSKKTKRGIDAAIKRGRFVFGNVYGYKKKKVINEHGEHERGLREIVSEQAAVIREIFQLYHDGETLHAICHELNRRKIPSPTGKKWAPSTLAGSHERKTGLLRQTLYRGIYTTHRFEWSKHPETGKRISRIRPQSEWRTQPAPEMQILEPELFEAVQKKLDARASLPSWRKDLRASNDYFTEYKQKQKHRATEQLRDRKRQLFVYSGKVWCGIHRHRIEHKRSNHYSCPEKYCRFKCLGIEELNERTLRALEAFTFKDLGYKNPRTTPKIKKFQDDILELGNRKQEVIEKIERLYGEFAHEASPTLRRVIHSMEQEVTALNKKIRVRETNLAFYDAPILTQQEAYHKAIKDLIRRFKKDQRDEFAVTNLRNIIRSIEIKPVKSRIQYNLEYFNAFIRRHKYIKPD